MTKHIKLFNKDELRDIILTGHFDDSIQIKNDEHICKDGTIYDYSSITNLSSMFSGCENLTTVPSFDTSNIINMHSMFSGCKNLTTVPLFTTSNVNDMYSMFYNCQSLTSIPFFDTSNVYFMSFMFEKCKNLKTIPSLDISRIEELYNFYGIFDNCFSLSKIEQVKFFYQKDKLLLKNLETNPELFSETKLDQLLLIFI